MAMVVKNNMSAVRTLNTLNNNSNALQGSLAKVSSGMKINSAQDDASGYAISERMRVQIRSLDQANQNTQNGSSLMKTAEGAVSKTVEILKSLKEKAISAATDTNTDSDRVTIQKEIDQFIDQIDDNALVTFNGKYLVDGSKTQAGKATYTAMTNQSLATDTGGATAMTDLKNRNNEELEIASTDYVTASFVKDGKTFTTKYQVGSTTLEDVFKKLNDVATDAGIGEVFGAARLSDPDESAKDKAKALLGAATADEIFAAAVNPNDTTQIAGDTNSTVADLAQAIATLGATGTDNAYSVAGVTSLEDATDQLKTAVEDVYDDVDGSKPTITFGASGDPASTLSDTVVVTLSATLQGNAEEIGTITYTPKAAGTPAGGGSYTSTNSNIVVDTDAGVSKAVASIAAVAATATTKAAITTEMTNATTLTADQPTETGNNSTIATANDFAAPTAIDTTGDPAKNYITAVAIDRVITALASNDGLVSKGSDVGLAASGDMVSTANGENGVTVTAANKEIAGQISGLAISISDSQGNVKKSANASLDAFSTTIFAANGSKDNALKFQVGATSNLSITVGLADMRSEALGLKGSDGSKVSVATQAKANAAIATFDNALQKALDIQTTIGAVEARLDYTSSNLTTSSENVQAAESTIRDADMAKEMTNYTKNNVLLQAAQSMLAQANQNSSAVLSLLQ